MKYYQVIIIYRNEKYICGLACNNLNIEEICRSLELSLANMSLTDRDASAVVKEISKDECDELVTLKTGLRRIRKLDNSIKVLQFKDRAKIYGYSPIYTMIQTVFIKLGAIISDF